LELQDRLEKLKRHSEEELTSSGNRTILASYKGTEDFVKANESMLPQDVS
jgi:hypothetical protein